MWVSAEVRYFWSAFPPEVDRWFRSGIPPGGGQSRVDEYLRDPQQIELGMKRRGQNPGVEIKGLVAHGKTGEEPFAGRVQIWTKWTSEALRLDSASTVAITKQRWLRKFDTGPSGCIEFPLKEDETRADGQDPPADGCNLEFTRVTLPDGAVWWTLGLEAFGALDRVEATLAKTIECLAATGPPRFRPDRICGYPEFLAAWERPIEETTR